MSEIKPPDIPGLPPPFRLATMADTGAVPFLAPGTLAAAPIPGQVDWARSPACPNDPSACRITMSMVPVQNPIPTAIVNGKGQPNPALVVQAKQHGTCTVCKLSWDIVVGPQGPNELPITPIPPPPVIKNF